MTFDQANTPAENIGQAVSLTGDQLSSTQSHTKRAYPREVYMQLQEDIINGALKPNQKPKTEQLRKCYEVPSVNARQIAGLLKTRCWLEEMALRNSMIHGHSKQEEKEILVANRLNCFPQSDAYKQFVSNAEWETRHNHQLAVKNAYPVRDMVAEHGAIHDAALARNANQARELKLSQYKKRARIEKRNSINKHRSACYICNRADLNQTINT